MTSKRPLTPYNRNRCAVSSVLEEQEEIEDIVRQWQVMRPQQSAEENGSLQRKISELSENLEHERTENRTLCDQVEYLSAELVRERQLRQQDLLVHKLELQEIHREFRQKYDMDVNVKQEIIVTLEKKLDMTQKNYAIKLNELKIKLEKAGDKSSSAQDEM